MNFEGFDGIRGMAVMGRFVLVFAFLGLLFGLLVMLPVAYENNPPLSDKDGVATDIVDENREYLPVPCHPTTP